MITITTMMRTMTVEGAFLYGFVVIASLVCLSVLFCLLTFNFLVAVVNTLNSSKEISEISFENADVKNICYCKQRMKSKLSLFQTVWKRSSVSRAHLSPHTYTARVEWCGIGHKELMIYPLRRELFPIITLTWHYWRMQYAIQAEHSFNHYGSHGPNQRHLPLLDLQCLPACRFTLGFLFSASFVYPRDRLTSDELLFLRSIHLHTFQKLSSSIWLLWQRRGAQMTLKSNQSFSLFVRSCGMLRKACPQSTTQFRHLREREKKTKKPSNPITFLSSVKRVREGKRESRERR